MPQVTTFDPLLTSPPPIVLVVEDQVLVRMMLREYLQESGLHVIEAGSADEAILTLRTNEQIDLVFSDVVMPGSMDGFGLARWIAQERNRLDVILSSGYHGADRVMSEANGRAKFIAKPYLLLEVVCLIRELLDHRSTVFG